MKKMPLSRLIVTTLGIFSSYWLKREIAKDLSSESQLVVDEIEREMATYLEKKIKKIAVEDGNKNLERKDHNDGEKPVIKKEKGTIESASNQESEPQSNSSDSVLSTFNSTSNTSEEEKPQKVKQKRSITQQ